MRTVSRTLAAGEHLFRQGDPATAVFRVLEGRVRLARVMPDGTALTLHVARSGEGFAEAALFSEAYRCDAVAETRTRIEATPKAELLARLAGEPGRAMALLRDMAGQVHGLRLLLELRNLRRAEDRLLAWLSLAAEGAPPTVRLDRPLKALGPELGLSHEALYRALARLVRSGAVERRPGALVLLRRA